MTRIKKNSGKNIKPTKSRRKKTDSNMPAKTLSIPTYYTGDYVKIYCNSDYLTHLLNTYTVCRLVFSKPKLKGLKSTSSISRTLEYELEPSSTKSNPKCGAV